MTLQDSGCLASDDGRRSGKSRVLSRCVRSSSDMACRSWSNTWWERSRERGFFSSHLISSHLIFSHLTASSPGRRRIPASSGVAPSGPGLPAGGTCRGRRSWARKAGPPCVGHRAESSLKPGLGKKGRVAGRRCRSENVRRHR